MKYIPTKNNRKLESENKKASENLPVEKPASQVVRKLTDQEVKDLISKIALMDCDPMVIMRELSEKLPGFVDHTLDKETEKKIQESIGKAMMIHSLDTQAALVVGASPRYQSMAIEIGRQLAHEFQCKTPSEKALVQSAAGAYARIIETAARFEGCLQAGEYISNERTMYLSVLSKHLDRCNRQFMTAITTLKQIKSPTIEFNIKSKTAYVSQNQQINSHQESKTSENATS